MIFSILLSETFLFHAVCHMQVPGPTISSGSIISRYWYTREDRSIAMAALHRQAYLKHRQAARSSHHRPVGKAKSVISSQRDEIDSMVKNSKQTVTVLYETNEGEFFGNSMEHTHFACL